VQIGVQNGKYVPESPKRGMKRTTGKGKGRGLKDPVVPAEHRRGVEKKGGRN